MGLMGSPVFIPLEERHGHSIRQKATISVLKTFGISEMAGGATQWRDTSIACTGPNPQQHKGETIVNHKMVLRSLSPFAVIHFKSEGID